MNVGFEEYSTSDVARMLHLDKTTISGWCRAGKIRFTNVSDGNTNGRYLITEDEVNYLRQLCKNYGKRGAIKHYNKKRLEEQITKKKEEEPVQIYPWVLDTDVAEEESEKRPPIKETKKSATLDSMTTTLGYIQDIKERLEDLKAEENQLRAELRDLQKEVMDFIGCECEEAEYDEVSELQADGC